MLVEDLNHPLNSLDRRNGQIILRFALSLRTDIGADMVFANLRILLVLVGLVSVRLHAQNVQPGLEAAVRWKWRALPSEEKDWGFPVTEPIQAPAATPTNGPTLEKKPLPVQAGTSIAPGNYEVKRGDALAI